MSDQKIPWWELPGAPGENRTREQYNANIAALKEPSRGKSDPALSTNVEELRRTINAQKVELASRNLRITGLEETLKDTERFMSYFAGETCGSFVGPRTPTSCLERIRRILAVSRPQSEGGPHE